jgi:hypothetical protein
MRPNDIIYIDNGKVIAVVIEISALGEYGKTIKICAKVDDL